MRAAAVRERLPILITATTLVSLIGIVGWRFGGFFTPRVMANLFADNAFLGIAALGLTFVVLTGGIDLSVGATIGVASMAAAVLMRAGAPVPLALGLPLAYGAGLGWLQGFLVARYEIPPFLVTLAGLFFGRGVALGIGRESVRMDAPAFVRLTEWGIEGPARAVLTAPAAVFLFAAAAATFVAACTRFGRAVYAIGGSAGSAKLMGVPVARTLVGTYVLSGVFASLAGIVFAVYTSSGNATAGVGLELDAIAAVVIGGTVLAGGYGSPFGTVLGVLVLGVVQTALSFEGTLSSWWTRIVIGGLLFVFLLVQRGIGRLARRVR